MGSGNVLTCGMTALAASHRCCAARMSGLFSRASRTRLLSSRRGSASSGVAAASPAACQPPSSARPSTQRTHRLMTREGLIDTPHGLWLSSDPLSAMMGYHYARADLAAYFSASSDYESIRDCPSQFSVPLQLTPGGR